MDKDVLDLESLVASEFGGTVSRVNPDGTVDIKVPSEDGSTRIETLNVPQMMRDFQINPETTEIKYNSPELAAEPSDLNFSTRLRLSLAGNIQDMERLLKQEFGEDNVQVGPDGLVVREDGVWKKADSNFWSDLVSNAPEMLGGIQGAKIGAVIGTMVLPGAGTVIGGIAGGAIGSALAKVIKNKGAEAAGIRSDYDADQASAELSKEIAWNLAIDSVLGVGGAIWRGFGKPLLKVASRGIKTSASNLTRQDKSVMAETLEKLVPGTSRKDWITVGRSPEDAKAVLKDMDEMVQWRTQAATNPRVNPVDPLSRKMVRIAQATMNSSKNAAFQQYESGIKNIENSGAFDKAQIHVGSVAASFKETLADLGLLEKLPNGTLRVSRRPKPGSEQIMQVFDPKSLNTLSKVFDQLNSVTRPVREMAESAANLPTKFVEKPLSFKEAKSLLKGIDDILESSGYYNAGEQAISNNARRALMSLRSQLNERIVDSLKGKQVRIQGNLLDAGQYYKDIAGRYSRFRAIYDDFSLKNALGGTDQQALATLNRMLGDKGGNLEIAFQNLLKTVGKDPTPIVSRLQQLRAARNLSDIYAPTQTGLGTVIKGNLGISSSRAWAQSVAQDTIKQGSTLKKATPLSSGAKSRVETLARALDWIQDQSVDALDRLVSTPPLMREFSRVILNEPVTQQAMTQQMLQQVENR